MQSRPDEKDDKKIISEIVDLLEKYNIGFPENLKVEEFVSLTSAQFCLSYVKSLVRNKIFSSYQGLTLGTLFTAGIVNNQYRLVESIISKHRHGISPSHLCAAAEHNALATLGVLIDCGGNPNHTDNGLTPLHAAASKGHHEVVKFLLSLDNAPIHHVVRKRNPDHNLVSSEGNTPLHLAAAPGHLLAAQALIQAGANIEMRNDAGQTPLFLAIASFDPRDKTKEFTEQALTELVTYLLKLNAETNISAERFGAKLSVHGVEKHNLLTTPLHIAAQNGLTEIARLLIQHGASIHSTDKDELTPLDVAVRAGHRDIVIHIQGIQKQQRQSKPSQGSGLFSSTSTPTPGGEQTPEERLTALIKSKTPEELAAMLLKTEPTILDALDRARPAIMM